MRQLVCATLWSWQLTIDVFIPKELKWQSSVCFKSKFYFDQSTYLQKLILYLKTIEREINNSTSLPNAEILKIIIKRSLRVLHSSKLVQFQNEWWCQKELVIVLCWFYRKKNKTKQKRNNQRMEEKGNRYFTAAACFM